MKGLSRHCYVSRIGQFQPVPHGTVRFLPSDEFGEVTQQDGYKIEGVAVRPGADGSVEVFAGTDDENYGAALRQVWPIP